jgi:hypothetical protein
MDYHELDNKFNFSLFTKLLKRKINGALLSDEYLEREEKEIIDSLSFVDKKQIFNCPVCKKTSLAEFDQKNFKCDCEKILNLDEIDKETRYSINDYFYKKFLETIEKQITINDNKILCNFGEKNPICSQHNNYIILHITPFQKEMNTGDFICLDNAYLDHFLLNWNSLHRFLFDPDKIVNEMISWRLESIGRQINWSKINETIFQELCYELVEKEQLFNKLEQGGKGPDQGKDMFGYSFTKSAIGRPEEVKTLIQCKFTINNVTFSSADISQYVVKAKRHNCNYMLFITNGDLSGDARTEIHSNAYRTEIFRDIDVWNDQKLFILLKKHPSIRIKYFYSCRYT